MASTLYFFEYVLPFSIFLSLIIRSLGYMVSSDGKVENQDLFLNRVRGTVLLYAAIIQTPQLPTSQMPRPHPQGLEYGWAWLARMLNIEPHPVVTAAALGDFLEVSISYCLFHPYVQVHVHSV